MKLSTKTIIILSEMLDKMGIKDEIKNIEGKTNEEVGKDLLIIITTKLYKVEDLIYNGLSYAPIYDYNYYITRYKDIYNAFGDDKEAVFNHFINYGMKEGRQASENFNIKIYKNN